MVLRALQKILDLLLRAVPWLMGTLLLAMIIRSAVNVPHWDEWDYAIPSVLNFYNHGFSFHDLYANSGEHIIVIPRALFILDSLFTSLDIRALHILNFIFCVFIFLIIRGVAVTSAKTLDKTQAQKLLTLFGLALISMYIFSLGSAGVYLWGLASYIFTSVFFAVACFSLLSFLIFSDDPINSISFFGITLLIFVLCLMSLGSSLHAVVLCFTLFLGSLFFARSLERGRRIFLIFVFALELCLIIGLIKAHQGYGQLHFLENGLLSLIQFNILYAGSNFDVHNFPFALFRGSLIWVLAASLFCGLFSGLLPRGAQFTRRRDGVFFGLLLTYSFGTALSTAIGRESHSGWMAGLMDRYILYASLAFVSVSYLCIVVLKSSSIPTLIRGLMAVLVLLFSVDSVYTGLNSVSFRTFGDYKVERESALQALLAGEDSDALHKVYNLGLGAIQNQVDFLKSHRLGPFKQE